MKKKNTGRTTEEIVGGWEKIEGSESVVSGSVVSGDC
jgi:hypothetical protein